MAANLIATSTSSQALDGTIGPKVAVASDGTAFVLYYDGAKMVYQSAVSPYSSWSTATTLPSSGGSRYGAAIHYNAADDSIDVVYHSSTGGTLYVKLTYNSGTHTWSNGTAVTITTTSGSGSSGESVWVGRDGSGNIWSVMEQTLTTWEAYYSSNGGTTWNASITGASMPGGTPDAPGATFCGPSNRYLLVVYSNNAGQLAWRRCDTTGTLTTWTAQQTVNLGVNPDFYPGDFLSLTQDGSGRALLVMSSQTFNFGSGVWGKVYTPSTDTWGADTHLGTHTGGTFPDNWGTVQGNGTDAWAIYSHGIASNNYELDLKKWTNGSAAWDSSATVLEASGNNITFGMGFATASTLYFAYVQGTASPWSLYFDTLSISSSTHQTHTTSGALVNLSKHNLHTASGALAQLRAHVTHSATGALAQVTRGNVHTASGALAQLKAHVTHSASGALVGLLRHNTHTTSAAAAEVAKIPPMPVISRGQPASASDISYPPSNANDGNYGTIWTTGTPPSVGSPAYWAVDLSGVPVTQRQQVVLAWYNETADGYWLTSGFYANQPRDYTIQTNTAAGGTYPTAGWTTVATVTGNIYWTREHAFNLAGANWVQIVVTASNGASPNNGVSLQVDIHDAHQGDYDDLLVLGDSITAEAWFRRNPDGTEWTHGPVPQQIAAANGWYFPLMLDGGFGGMTMSWGATNIASLIAPFTGRYVAVQYGTNDLNVGFQMSTSQLASVYANLLTILDAIVAAGKVPIISYTPYGTNNSFYLGINAQAFNHYVDVHLPTDRAGQYLRGPDLYTPFYQNPGLLRDGIHPTYAANSDGTQTGYDLYHRTWRDWWIATIYGTPLQSHQATGVVAQLTRVSGAIHTYHTATGILAQVAYPNPHTASGALAQVKQHATHSTSGALAQVKQHVTHRATDATAQLKQHATHSASGAQAQVTRHSSHTTSGALAQLRAHVSHSASGALAQVKQHATHSATGALAQVKQHATHSATGALANILRHNTHSTSGALASILRHNTHSASGARVQVTAHNTHTAAGALVDVSRQPSHVASGALAQLRAHVTHSVAGVTVQVIIHNTHTTSGALANILRHNTHSASGALANILRHNTHTASGALAQVKAHQSHSASGARAQVTAHTLHTAAGVLAQIRQGGQTSHTASGALAQLRAHVTHSASSVLVNLSRHVTHSASGVVADVTSHHSHSASGALAQVKQHVTHSASGVLAQLKARTAHTASGAQAQVKQHTSHSASGALVHVNRGALHIAAGVLAQLKATMRHSTSGAQAQVKQHVSHSSAGAQAQVKAHTRHNASGVLADIKAFVLPTLASPALRGRSGKTVLRGSGGGILRGP